MKRIALWVCKGWPGFAFAIIVVCCECLLKRPCLEIGLPCFTSTEINRFLTFTFQLIGGGLVIYSVDSNIGLFKNKTLAGSLYNYLSELIPRKPVTVEQHSLVQISVVSSAKIGASKKAITIEEKMAYLQDQIDWLKKDLLEDRTKFSKLIEEGKRDSSASHRRLEQAHTELKKNLESVAIGGLKPQIFGVLLLVYGSFISIYDLVW
jgi:hypothetical protein